VGFYADSGNAPGALITNYPIPGNANETSVGNDSNGIPVFDYSTGLLPPFAAAAGVQYWLAIVPDLGFPPQWGWYTGTGGDNQSVQDFFGGRTVLPTDFAFTLSGQAVPEPSTLALTGLGMLGMGVWLRRRKQSG
jgi:hypothetical protein